MRVRFSIILLIFMQSGFLFSQVDYAKYVKPDIGAAYERWFFFQSATRPQGMVNLSPETLLGVPWDGGYDNRFNEIVRFSHVHQYHSIGPAFMPFTGAVDVRKGREGWKSGFEKSQEVIEPGYHKVHLDKYNIDVELTATCRVGFSRFTFNHSGEAKIALPMSEYIIENEANSAGGTLRKINNMQLEGEMNCRINANFIYKIFFVVSFDKPFENFNAYTDSLLVNDVSEFSGSNFGAFLRFNVQKGEELGMKTAISYCGTTYARENLNAELPGWNFDQIRADARKEWNERLSRIQVKGTENQLIKFYTDIFHSLVGRGIVDDVSGTYADFNTGKLIVRHLPPAINIAAFSNTTASSGKNSLKGITDGIVGVDGANEWVAEGQKTPRIRLSWNVAHEISRIDIYNRCNKSNGICSGRMVFSDGSEIKIDSLRASGTPTELIFPARKVSWVEFVAEKTYGSSPGLAEIKVYPASSKPDFHLHNSDSFWWTFNNLNTLWSMVYPDMINDFAKGFLLMSEIDPEHRLVHGAWGGRACYIMTGSQATPIIARALAMNMMGQNAAAAYQLIKRDHLAMTDFIEKGYVVDKKNWGSSSITMENCYTSWVVAQQARKSGNMTDYKLFTKLSTNWQNIFHPEFKYIWIREQDGNWRKPFDPLGGYNKGFVEGNAAQFTWFIMHDVANMAKTMGGNTAFCARLEEQFRKAEQSRFMYQYGEGWVNYGNQSDLWMHELFNQAGQPWLTQYWTRKVHDLTYSETQANEWGYGRRNEDQGIMASLSALMSMGISSSTGLTAAQPVFEITSSKFNEITFRLDAEGQKSFTIKVNNNSPGNVFVQSAKLNGNPLSTFWFKEKDFREGGLLELNMGKEPNKSWGTK